MVLEVDGRALDAAASEIFATAKDRGRVVEDAQTDARIRARLRELARIERDFGTLFTRRFHAISR